ncbi:MAG: hypothetical protein ABI867_27280, partial [Kofleriaceae bacterium]
MLRIKLRYDDIETMVQRFAPNVGKSGLFLPTRSVQPVGAEIKFELRLVTEQPMIVGLGRVKVVKEPDPNDPKATFGMAIELMRVTRESRDLILRMLERRRAMGLVDVAIPMPSDIDAARRADVETAITAAPTAPAAPAPEPQSEGLLTSPRKQSGAFAVAKVTSVPAVLAPEPVRRKRPGLQELIDRASGPVGVVTVQGLDDEADVDVAAVLARARALASGDLDAELEALRELQAAPLEIGIEAAPAELARALGGSAVRRDRSAGWAPPPLTTRSVAVEEPPPAVVAEPAPEPEPEPAPEPPEPADTFSHAEAAIDALGDELGESPGLPIDDEEARERARDIAFLKRLAEEDAARERASHPEPEPEPEHEVEPEQIHDEIHQLSEADFEEVEHTAVGAEPLPFEDGGLADQLDAHLAEVEAQHEHDDLGIGEASGVYRDAAPTLPPDYEDDPAFSLDTAHAAEV